MSSKYTEENDKLWPQFYQLVENEPARPWTLRGLSIYDELETKPEETTVIDLGCGAGNDTLEFLKRGWSVFATDHNGQAFEYLRQRIPPELSERLTTQQGSFEEIDLPQAHLINASYSLPFGKPECFETVMDQISNALSPNGFFMGQFFGTHDEWYGKRPWISFHTKEQVLSFFNNTFNIITLEDKQYDGGGPDDIQKHWHVFTVYAQKLDPTKNTP